MALPPQQFCVRWNSYHTNLQTVFPRLLLTEQFADVTLACESRQLRCHKLVLSACSAYLEQLLLQNPCKHPIVFMKDMRFSEMQALVDFMYKGEVNVTQDELPSLLKSAEALQIRGLCSGDTSGVTSETKPTETKDFAVATEALLAQAHRENVNGQTTLQKQPTTNGNKKQKTEEAEVKEETVEEDGLYYGELDNDNMEYNEDDDSGKPGSSLGQTSDFAIANVQCHYESPEPGLVENKASPAAIRDHTYDKSDIEPSAFIIQRVHLPTLTQPTPVTIQTSQPYVEVRPGLMTVGPDFLSSVNVIHVGDSSQVQSNKSAFNKEPELPPYITKRIRRSDKVLKEAADCVSKGLTFQTVSERFNIPISTIRFYMARKGILPRRRRGRHVQFSSPTSPSPPFHMQHFKLPDMIAMQSDDEKTNVQKDESSSCST